MTRTARVVGTATALRRVLPRGDEQLPALRVVMLGRRWWDRWQVQQIERVIGGARYIVLELDLHEDVRERVVEEIRPDVVAMWSDPREWLGLPPTLADGRRRTPIVADSVRA